MRLDKNSAFALILLAIAVFLVWQTSSVIFIAFGGFLLGVVGAKVISWLASGTKLSWRLNFLLFLLIVVLIFGGLGILLYLQISSGANEFSMQAGDSFRLLDESLGRYGLDFNESTKEVLLRLAGGGIIGGSFNLFISLLGILIGFLLVIAIGIFYMYDPKTYDGAFLSIFSDKKIQDGFEAAKTELQRWTIGMLASMLIVGVLTLIGLFIIGLPFPFTLALIAGLLAFIPNLGPILSVVPAILVALAESPVLVIDVIFLYVMVQLVESNLITPLIQKRMVSVQPAFFLVIQALFGVLFGFFGLLFAVPIAVAVRAFVLVAHPEISRRYHEDVRRSSNQERYRRLKVFK